MYRKIRKIKSLSEIEEILKERVNDISLREIPHFSRLKGIEEGALLIKNAIKNNEFITIIGDYDVDGITSSAIMYKFFNDLGYKNFEILIPNRFTDGYGISPRIIEKMNKKTSLVITVDNGITGYDAFKILREMNIKTILTDHHTPKRDEKGKVLIPDADVIINPKVDFDYHMKEICGAEVAWFLIGGIKKELNLDIDMREYLDYLAIAVIADVMPLIDLNRAIVIAGLKKIKRAEKPFSAVLNNYFNKIDSTTIAFQIAPRLNASGRLGDATKSFKFLIATSYEEADSLFRELTLINENRKEIQKDISDNIEPIIYDRFVFAIGDFHQGLTGIIASKLVERYKKPCIVFSKNNNILTGSGRSVGNVDLFKLINPLKDLYIKFGGHPGACGLSIEGEKFDEFARVIDSRSKEMFKEEDYFIDENILGEIDFNLINDELLDILEKYEPYGFGNPTPVFITKNLKVEAKEIIKDSFLKMLLNKNDKVIESIIFDKIDVGDFINEIKFSVKRGYYGNPTLIIKDVIQRREK